MAHTEGALLRGTEVCSGRRAPLLRGRSLLPLTAPCQVQPVG